MEAIRAWWQRSREQYRKHPRATAAAVVAYLGLLTVGGYFGYRWWWVPRSEFRAGEAALVRFDFEAARTHLQKCVAAWPSDPQANFLLSQAGRRAEDFDAAAQYLDVAEQMGQPANAIHLENLLAIIQRQGATPADMTLLTPFMQERGPNEILVLEALTSGLYRHQRLSETAHFLGYWVDKYPEDWRAYQWRGSFHFGTGRHSQAQMDFERVLALKPDHNEALRGLGVTLAKSGSDYPKAIDVLRRFLQSSPNDVEAISYLARSQRQATQTAEARKTLERAIAANRVSFGIYLLLGQLESDDDRLAESAQALKQAEVLPCNDSEELYTQVSLMGNVQRRLGNKDEAERCELRLKQLTEDLRAMNEATDQLMEKGPTSDLLCRLGAIYLRIGMEQEGTARLIAILKRDNNNARAHQLLLEHYLKKNDPDSLRKAAIHRQMLAENSAR